MKTVAVIGGGPAGLMAAEILSHGNIKVDLYDSMPSAGRKFLVAGKSGLNLTRIESEEQFLIHYGINRSYLGPLIAKFGPDEIQEWVHNIGVETFIGTSGKVFPVGMHSGTILSNWLRRLRASGVCFNYRHKWVGWHDDDSLIFETRDGFITTHPEGTVLALGGGSWPQLGSTGDWVPILSERGISCAPLKPSNCGFNVTWSDHFRKRFEGVPVKTVGLSFVDCDGNIFHQGGDIVITRTGVEGNPIYAFSSHLRDEIESTGKAVVTLDLAPGWSKQRLLERLSLPRGSRTFSGHLEKSVQIKGVKAGLLYEFIAKEKFGDAEYLSTSIKNLALTLISPRPLEEAISSAGGVRFEELDGNLMIKSMPGVFCAGEMLDWEAPTGGYLLTACFASGHAAGTGALEWLTNS